MHAVVVLALERVLAFDLSTPVEVFGRARLPDGRAAYRVLVAASAEEVGARRGSARRPRVSRRGIGKNPRGRNDSRPSSGGNGSPGRRRYPDRGCGGQGRGG